MATDKSNSVRMIGPKGKISYVSRKASQSIHLANLGFRIAQEVVPIVDVIDPAPFDPPDDSTKRSGALGSGFKPR